MSRILGIDGDRRMGLCHRRVLRYRAGTESGTNGARRRVALRLLARPTWLRPLDTPHLGSLVAANGRSGLR
jgi:hypothetical protein